MNPGAAHHVGVLVALATALSIEVVVDAFALKDILTLCVSFSLGRQNNLSSLLQIEQVSAHFAEAIALPDHVALAIVINQHLGVNTATGFRCDCRPAGCVCLRI